MITASNIRAVTVGTQVAAIAAALVFGAWIVWPAWQRHRAVNSLMDAVQSQDEDAVERLVAEVVRTQGGDAAVPFLLDALRDDNPRIRRAAAMALKRIGPDADDLASIEAIDEWGPVASTTAAQRGQSSPSAGDLLRTTRSDRDSTAGDSSDVLVAGVEPNDDLTDAQMALDPDEAIRAAEMLADETGDRSSDATATLTDALSAADPRARLAAVLAMSERGVPAGAVPALLVSLGDEDDDVAAASADALSAAGAAAQAALPTLLDLLDEETRPSVRLWIARAVWKIDGQPDEAIPVLTAALDDAAAGVRSLAARFLGEIGPPARSAAAALTRLLDDEDDDVARQAAESLASIAGEPPP